MPSTHSALAMWCVTLSVRKCDFGEDPEPLRDALSEVAKSYCFQLEEGQQNKHNVNYDSDNSDSDYSDSDKDQFTENVIVLGGTESDVSSSEIESEEEYSDFPSDFSEPDTDCEYDSDDSDDEDDGYIHWQISLSLHKRRRWSEIRRILVDTDNVLQFGHWSPSHSTTRASLYCMKADTRIKGPFKDTDEKPPYIPVQIAKISKLYPWQQELIYRSLPCNHDHRSINIIYDRGIGNQGKSFICSYMAVHRLARNIPPFNGPTAMDDIMACIMAKEPVNCYLIDQPRSMLKRNMAGFFSGVEMISNGYIYEKRYAFRERWQDSPSIFIFTNEIPDSAYLSKDRWKLWVVDNDTKELLKYPSLEKCSDYIIPFTENELELLRDALHQWRNFHTSNSESDKSDLDSPGSLPNECHVDSELSHKIL